MFSKIMVPLDGSKQAEAALEYACDLAQNYSASLHLIRVCWGPMQVLLKNICNSSKKHCEFKVRCARSRQPRVTLPNASLIVSPSTLST